MPPPKSNGEKILGKLGKDINISGGMSITSQQSAISGGDLARETYNQQNGQLFDTRRIGPFNQSMDLTIQGKIFNAFSINARLSNSRYGNAFNQRFGFNYKSKGTSINVGDVNASLGGNELVSFARSLQGLQFSRDFGGGKVRMSGIASLTRALTRRGTFQGNGTTGPYYVNGSNILEGTEKLRLNGTELVAGTDYRIDYNLGQVTFSAGRIINATDTVEFTYESQNYNTTPGLLTGTRWDLGMGKGANIGVTYIQQKALAGRGDGIQAYRFPVEPDPSYQYNLTPAIAPGAPVEIKWFEQVLVENVDYVLNRQLNLFRLTRPLPADTAATANASLSVRYQASQQNGVGGDRNVMGLDMNMPIGSLGNVAVQYGQSKGVLDSQTGQGMTVRANFKSQGNSHKNSWNFSTAWRNIGTGFSTIDSTSGAFLNAEKGLQSTLSFSPNDFVQITTSLVNSKIATNSFNTTGDPANPAANALTWTSNQNFNTDIGLTFPNLPSIRLTHGQVSQNSGPDGKSRSTFTNDQISLSWQKGILGLSAALGRTAAKGRTVFGNYSSTIGNVGLNGGLIDTNLNNSFNSSSNDSTSDTSRIQLSLNPAAWISLSGSLGLSRNRFGTSSDKDSSGSSSSARDTGLVVNLTPMQNLSLTASLTNSSNGQSTSNFFNPTTATSLNPSGTSNISGQRTNAATYTFQYTPFERLSLNGTFSRALSLVPGYDNTESKSTDLGFNFAVFNRLQIAGQFTGQNLTYVGGQGNSNNRSYTMTGTAGPFGKLSFTSTLQRMDFGSAINNFGSTSPIGTPVSNIINGNSPNNRLNSTYLQQGVNTIWSVRTDYAIGGNRSLFFQWQSLDAAAPRDTYFNNNPGEALGYHSAQNYQRGTGTLGLEVRLTDIIAFTLDTNIISLQDRDNQKYSYRARAINMDLSARF